MTTDKTCDPLCDGLPAESKNVALQQCSVMCSCGFTDESPKDATNPALNKAFVTCRFTPEVITELKPNEIFVFGSNWAGRHGKGAALQAVKWGAKYGVGLGLEGQTFALPTKTERWKLANYTK